MKLVIQPILLHSRVDPLEYSYIKSVLETVFEFNKQSTVINSLIAQIPADLFDNSRNQYLSDHLLSWLLETLQPSQDIKVLGVCDFDAYFGKYNFCFGEAIIGGKVSAIYLTRLLPMTSIGNDESLKLFQERVLKEAIHEIGHTFGMRHCTSDHCIMFKSKTISDTDKKNAELCNVCVRLLAASLKFLEDV